MNRGVKEKLKTNNNNLEKLYKNIKILNPLSILDRGGMPQLLIIKALH